MQIRYLLLVPVLVLTAGCSEKIEAQQNDPEPSEIRMSLEQKDETAKALEEPETDLELHSPVVLD